MFFLLGQTMMTKFLSHMLFITTEKELAINKVITVNQKVTLKVFLFHKLV